MNARDPLPDPALAEKLAALAHPARIDIVRYLAGMDCCCCKDVVGRLDLAQSTVSQHLKVLVAAGLVRMVNDRQRSLYSVDRAALDQLGVAVTGMMRNLCAGEHRPGDREQ